MSKYKPTQKVEKQKRLDELIRQLGRVEDEIAPLEVYRDNIKSSIKDVMKELGIDEYKGTRLITEKIVLSDVEKLVENYESMVPFLVAEVDKKQTLHIMYENHINYEVAKRKIEDMINDTKWSEETYEKVKSRTEI